MLRYLPWFGWLGIVSVVGFYISVIIMIIAKKKRKPKLRKYHIGVAGASLLLATIHGIYALLIYL